MSFPDWLTVENFNKIALATVAIVATIVGPLLQWRIAKRQAADNVSSKRQNWIDELRKDTAEFLVLMARLEELRRPPADIDAQQAQRNFEDLAQANLRASELAIRIKLRLNPHEDEHKELVRLFGVLSDACKDPPEDETAEQAKAAQKAFGKARDNVVSHVQSILKHEWERVKRGDV
jgi:hypothetical protein